MYLYAGIISIILGIAIAILGFTNILPYLGTTGIFLCLLGGLFIGLNFIPTPAAEGGEPMPIWERLTKIFFSPSEVFRSFRTHPFWLGAIIIASIVSGIYSYAFVQRITPEVIANHTVEKLSEAGFVQPEQIEVIKKQNLETAKSPLARIGSFINTFVGYCFLAAFLGIVYLLIVLAFGGTLNFWQGLAVAAYVIFPVTLIQKLSSLLILYLKEPTNIHPVLGQGSLLMDNLSFLVSPGETPVLYVLLASISLLSLYSIFLTATGLKNAGTKVSPTTAWIISIIMWLLGLTLGVISAFFFGGMFG